MQGRKLVPVGKTRYPSGTEYTKAYGEKLRRLRMKEGLSQGKVAEALGTSQPAVAMWESGDRWPQIPDLLVLARLYGCSVADLVPDLPDDEIITQLSQQEKPEKV